MKINKTKRKNKTYKKKHGKQSKRYNHRGGYGIATAEQKQDWETGLKDLDKMTKEDLAVIKNQYEDQIDSIGSTFKNFKMSVGNSEPVRPAPVPPECVIL